MSDEIERRLRTEVGARERGYLRPALPVIEMAARARTANPQRTRGRAWAVVAVLATATLAVAVTLFLGDALGGSPQADRGVGAGGTPPPSATAEVSTPTPTASVPSLEACGPQDFAVSAAAWDAAAGSRGTTVVLRLVDSAAPCVVAGAPAAGIDDAAGTTLISSPARSGRPMTLHAGEMLSLGLSWSNWCATSPQQPLSAWIVLPGGDPTLAADRIPVTAPSGQLVPVPPCNGSAQPAALNVGDFAPYGGPMPPG